MKRTILAFTLALIAPFAMYYSVTKLFPVQEKKDVKLITKK